VSEKEFVHEFYLLGCIKVDEMVYPRKLSYADKKKWLRICRYKFTWLYTCRISEYKRNQGDI